MLSLIVFTFTIMKLELSNSVFKGTCFVNFVSEKVYYYANKYREKTKYY